MSDLRAVTSRDPDDLQPVPSSTSATHGSCYDALTMDKSAIRDREWISQVRSGDAEALGLLYEHYQGVLFRLIFVRVGDRDLAQEIVQETFLKIWQKRKSLKPKLAFLPFISKIGKNLLHDYFKHQGVQAKHRDHIVSMVDVPPEKPDQTLSHRMLQEKITETVNAKLGERCRTVFLLSRVEGLKNKEIADLLQISKKTVENQLTHALKVIRKHCKTLLAV